MKDQFDRRVENAQDKAHKARSRVIATLAEVRHRIDPRVIAAEAADQVSGQISRLLTTTTEAARARPWLLALGATMFGLIVTMRSRLSTDATTTEIDRSKATNDVQKS